MIGDQNVKQWKQWSCRKPEQLHVVKTYYNHRLMEYKFRQHFESHFLDIKQLFVFMCYFYVFIWVDNQRAIQKNT